MYCLHGFFHWLIYWLISLGRGLLCGNMYNFRWLMYACEFHLILIAACSPNRVQTKLCRFLINWLHKEHPLSIITHVMNNVQVVNNKTGVNNKSLWSLPMQMFGDSVLTAISNSAWIHWHSWGHCTSLPVDYNYNVIIQYIYYLSKHTVHLK